MGDDDTPTQKRSGCGLLNLVFGRRSIRPRRSTSTSSLPSTAAPTRVTRYPSTPSHKIRHQNLDDSETTITTTSNNRDRIIQRPGKRHHKSPHIHQGQAKNNANTAATAAAGAGKSNARKAPQAGPGFGLSGELESMIKDYQRSKVAGNLVLGNLGNLRQQPGNTNAVSAAAAPENNHANAKYATSVMGNVVAKKTNEPEQKPVSLCRALSTRMDPEELKILGNEDYRNGRFAEALALYDAAISIDPNKASYRSNKSAALVALGKLLEAALECREAIRIDPFYQRAHNRLALVYVRLGEAERALHHFKQAGSDADPDATNRAKQVQIHLNKCTEAKRHRDWSTLLKESALAIDAGADSAPSIFGLRAEALLKMNRHEEAIEAMKKSPKFDIDLCTKFFGPIGTSSLLVFQSQVHLVAGRFDEGVAAAQGAARLDPKSKEASAMAKKARAVAAARSNGNELFKAARYSEACIAYGEGLSHDPYNAVLLCNRAACRSKLGQLQKAVEDCNAALRVRPSHAKARLRRADCYAKIGKWAACVQDCEALLRENRDDEEVLKMMEEVEAQLKKRGGSSRHMDDAGGDAAGLVVVSSNEHFRGFVASPGICVVLFSTKTADVKILQLVEQLYKRHPSLNFLKVVVEDHPSLAKSEGLNSFPSFIIYTNGSRVDEVRGDNLDLLESSIKSCIRS